MRIALAQINPTVGALDANRRLILDAYRRAADLGADLVVYPELALTGYPPKDLLDLPCFLRRAMEGLDRLAAEMTGPGAIVGYVHSARDAGETHGKGIYNAAALIDAGAVRSRHFKSLLPTYDVFDEARYFEPAHEVCVAEFRGRRLAITICEDFWSQTLYELLNRRIYHRDPLAELAGQGVDLMIHIAASPFTLGKVQVKAAMYRAAARRWGKPLIHVNVVGGNDNLIFDGGSNVWNAEGRVVAQAPQFEEALLLWDSDAPGEGREPDPEHEESALYGALKLGIHDYVAKCGFERVLLGLSGGIDSALTAVLAADALGPARVTGVAMPSRFSSRHSRDDARRLADNLAIDFHTLAIEPIYQAYLAQLEPLFAGTPFGLAEENLQARTRGNLLMALSNKFGWLLLSTGNKSEMAVGYCTLYGDMSGGLCVLGDVLKTKVFRLSRWLNRRGARIPESTLTKPPSAELRPNQKDSDSLPEYDILDPIIEAYVERREGPEEIIAAGHDAQLVRRVLRMIDRSEFKRQQAAPLLKVTAKAFDTGRRMPIARGD
ncbi:MAG TPA: NAD+ synthase [Candidatus Sumerlaeota bacterium]|nr:NAD+ synthase [Candidatus Sumerlaeota bacterium]HOR27279.1 NAD+ synthase [Candidatus Sumerlaeota bacterium]HPK03662.1 NAD+ synthase [Candidatus Sumerlaeota bacterium]